MLGGIREPKDKRQSKAGRSMTSSAAGEVIGVSLTPDDRDHLEHAIAQKMYDLAHPDVAVACTY